MHNIYIYTYIYLYVDIDIGICMNLDMDVRVANNHEPAWGVPTTRLFLQIGGSFRRGLELF